MVGERDSKERYAYGDSGYADGFAASQSLGSKCFDLGQRERDLSFPRPHGRIGADVRFVDKQNAHIFFPCL
ncbi:hypothetical protein CJ030_MR6G013295 [Morella rubra]|uniref:Uncharacterized protein n=1 Tax=Morella rubra TaxID=262757 RepID=A0A6A1VFS0_9ROSI|nr:hypothetical protein CJ030_MR6G013295 [Morella rubra]